MLYLIVGEELSLRLFFNSIFLFMPEEVHFNKEDHTPYPEFNRRFERFRDPELNWESMEQGRNEFGYIADAEFEKHLKYLRANKDKWKNRVV